VTLAIHQEHAAELSALRSLQVEPTDTLIPTYFPPAAWQITAFSGAAAMVDVLNPARAAAASANAVPAVSRVTSFIQILLASAKLPIRRVPCARHEGDTVEHVFLQTESLDVVAPSRLASFAH